MRTHQLVNTCAHLHHIRHPPLDRSQVMFPHITCPITVTPLPQLQMVDRTMMARLWPKDLVWHRKLVGLGLASVLSHILLKCLVGWLLKSSDIQCCVTLLHAGELMISLWGEEDWRCNNKESSVHIFPLPSLLLSYCNLPYMCMALASCQLKWWLWLDDLYDEKLTGRDIRVPVVNSVRGVFLNTKSVTKEKHLLVTVMVPRVEWYPV